MKLTSFQVKECQSIWDSGEVEVNDVTCLVGKNEAGKTALLQALYKINPIIETHANFDVTDDYPRKEIGDYRHDVEAGTREQATVIEAHFELEEPDTKAVAAVFGKDALRSHRLTLEKGYSNETMSYIDFDDRAARAHLIQAASLTGPLRDNFSKAEDWNAALQVLDEAEVTEEITQLKALINQFKDEGAEAHAYNSILDSRVPKFLYFDEYYRLVGHENVNALIARKDSETLEPSDYPLLGLINLARLNLSDLLNVQRTLELTNTLEGAGNHLTRQILKYWSRTSTFR